MDPVAPLTYKQRWDHRQRQCRIYDAGSIYTGKAGDERLTLRLLFTGIFHQLQNPRHGGFLIRTVHPNPQNTGAVDTAADDAVTRRRITGHRLSGKGCGIQCGNALQHRAVQRNPLAGMYHHHLAYLRFLRRQCNFLSAPLQMHSLRTDIHQRGNGLAGTSHSIALTQLAHLIEQHDKYRLAVIADGKSAQCCHSHQEILIKHAAPQNIAARTQQNVPSHHKVGCQIEKQRDPTISVQQLCRDQQSNTHRNADQHGFSIAAAVVVTAPTTTAVIVVMVFMAAAAMLLMMGMLVAAAAALLMMGMLVAAATTFVFMFAHGNPPHSKTCSRP